MGLFIDTPQEAAARRKASAQNEAKEIAETVAIRRLREDDDGEAYAFRSPGYPEAITYAAELMKRAGFKPSKIERAAVAKAKSALKREAAAKK